jgi:FtsP/CotA-like multicopper oxidase with cupredoxin domain
VRDRNWYRKFEQALDGCGHGTPQIGTTLKPVQAGRGTHDARHLINDYPSSPGPEAIYREYTNETFSTLKPHPAEWEHTGLLGPVLRAEVGDTIKVVFKNNATHPFAMHPHGVFYAKDSEGTGYNDGASTPDKKGVPPGKTHTYIWEVPERAGPGPNDPSSICVALSLARR